MGPSLAMAAFFIPQWLRTITVAGEQMQSFVNALADHEVASSFDGLVVFFAVPAEEYGEIEFKNQLKNEGKIR